ncbi:hypothetical protein HYFRA_00004294 [Hymenoscyphus fraxineus]|uniref:Uncharacterized protein n=1 Tax=Hymenoscyphus fraxineus TaxID=746836 RepID=A0A9N9KQY0_9HELO|nr:hypothetical protein HYFRA_00004294 [Hymenoscyphus fraxineus]
MLSTSSPFISSSVSIYHNAIKSLVFSAAELLLAFSVWKFWSLIAAKGNLFASYLMFMEDPIQKFYFIISRGFSRASLVLFLFTTVYTAASLYGTLLWGLDAPGYIMRSANTTAMTLKGSLLESPGYITYLDIRPNKLPIIEKDLPQLLGAQLFQTGVNFSLTTNVRRGRPEYTNATLLGSGPRIWLDSEGLSVSVDTNVMTSYMTNDTAGRLIPNDCPTQFLGQTTTQFWNCTFNNTFVQPLLTGILGQPEVHWDDASDIVFDTRYIKPDRKRNIWASFGQGGGSAGMKQMFTVTKGTRRHSFIESTTRYTLMTQPGIPFAPPEVDDFLRRTWSTNVTERQAPILTRLYNDLMRGQKRGNSYQFGLIDAPTNITSTQVLWQLLTPESDGRPVYSLIRVSVTNITLIRSENIAVAPIPLKPCDTTFMNVAYGGVIEDTDCSTAKQGQPTKFWGQIDTSAVLIMSGLGDGRSNISALAVDESIMQWSEKNYAYMDDLLISRGFILGIDPSLVTVDLSILRPAISYLQIFLVVLAALFALVNYLLTRHIVTAHWTSSLLAILLAPVDGRNEPGYINPVPDIRLREGAEGALVTVDGLVMGVQSSGGSVVEREGLRSDEVSHMSQEKVVVHEGQAFMIKE